MCRVSRQQKTKSQIPTFLRVSHQSDKNMNESQPSVNLEMSPGTESLNQKLQKYHKKDYVNLLSVARVKTSDTIFKVIKTIGSQLKVNSLLPRMIHD